MVVSFHSEFFKQLDKELDYGIDMLTETRYFVHYVHRGCLRLKKDLDDATSYSWQRPWELCLHNSLWCRLLSHRIAEAIHRIIFVQILRLFKREHNHRPLFVCRHIGVWEVTCSCYAVVLKQWLDSWLSTLVPSSLLSFLSVWLW